MRYHMGCGEQRLAGYVNVDLQETSATDLLMDLSASQLAELGPADVVFRNAFFEHLRRSTRVPHLRAVREALTEEGFVCYLGFPDFARVAQLYLDHGPGAVGPVFDLFNVYRYTHGDPEMASSDEAGRLGCTSRCSMLTTWEGSSAMPAIPHTSSFAMSFRMSPWRSI
jgi:hypothetical protein